MGNVASMERRGHRPAWFFRALRVGIIAVVGLMLTGCVDQYLRDIDSTARDLRSSDEFSAVNFEYERRDPITMPRSIYDYSAALHEDADLQETGRLIAEAAEKTGFVPDILVDEMTWVNSFYSVTKQRTAPDFTAQQWTEVLATARATHADELEVWQRVEYLAERDDDYEPKLLLTVRSEILSRGLDDFERLEDLEIPAGIEEVYVELFSGTDRSPWSYEQRSIGDRYHTTSDAPISIVALEPSNLTAARELLEAGQVAFGEVYKFRYHYGSHESTLEVVHAGDPDACDDNRAYAELARELLTTDLDVAITLKHASEPDAGGWAIYEESATGEPPINANPHGCSIEG